MNVINKPGRISANLKVDFNDISGSIISYELYQGIEICFQKFDYVGDINNISICQPDNINAIELCYCRNGRFEYELPRGKCLYIGAGDFNIELPDGEYKVVGFPLKYYEGVSIYLRPIMMENDLPEGLKAIDFNLNSFINKFCNNNHFILRQDQNMKEIFENIFCVPEEIRKSYLRLKIQELLLLLHTTDGKQKCKKEEYFSKHTVSIIKDIRNLIVKDPKIRYTIDELAHMYNLSPTCLKTCFKGVFGTTMSDYMKQFRMQLAADYLNNSLKSVADIAYEVGYSNQSKFASAFKEVMGATPLEYRKTIV